MDFSRRKNVIYLDACSSTPPWTEVVEVVKQSQSDSWANPSSIHSEGIRAAELLERSRNKISSIVNSKPSSSLEVFSRSL